MLLSLLYITSRRSELTLGYVYIHIVDSQLRNASGKRQHAGERDLFDFEQIGHVTRVLRNV